MAVVGLPYGENALQVEIPAGWLGEVARPEAVPPAADPERLILGALRQPVGSPPLRELARAGRLVALLVDDYTRGTPIRRVLPLVLNELVSAGVKAGDIRIVIAPGTHRPMTRIEIKAKLGAETVREYEVVSVSAYDTGQMVYLGMTSNGIPAWVNRAVVEADLRIGLGMITPHMDAGFSGGGKIVLPGACGAATVDAFHAGAMDDPENRLGDSQAPLRVELEKFVGEHRLLDFIVNLITTLEGEIFQCVGGHVVQAHRQGVAFARRAFGATVKRRYPIVVANCFPQHFDLWQSLKGLWSGDRMTEDNGTLILVTPASEGHGAYPWLAEYLGWESDRLRQELQSGQAADSKSAATALMIRQRLRRIHLMLVSTGLGPLDAARLGAEYFDTVESALETAVTCLPAEQRPGSVGVLTHAGILLPLIA